MYEHYIGNSSPWMCCNCNKTNDKEYNFCHKCFFLKKDNVKCPSCATKCQDNDYCPLAYGYCDKCYLRYNKEHHTKCFNCN